MGHLYALPSVILTAFTPVCGVNNTHYGLLSDPDGLLLFLGNLIGSQKINLSRQIMTCYTHTTRERPLISGPVAGYPFLVNSRQSEERSINQIFKRKILQVELGARQTIEKLCTVRAVWVSLSNPLAASDKPI